MKLTPKMQKYLLSVYKHPGSWVPDSTGAALQRRDMVTRRWRDAEKATIQGNLWGCYVYTVTEKGKAAAQELLAEGASP